MQVFIYMLLMFLFPWLTGALAGRYLNGDTDSPALNLACGYALIWGTAEVLALACYGLGAPLKVLAGLCAVLWLAAAACSVWLNRKRFGRMAGEILRRFRKGGMLAVLAVLAVLLQTAFVSSFQHVDDDDAYYAAAAETAVTTDSIMQYDPYTGNEYKHPPARYLLSPFPIYQAVLAELTGIAPVVLAHTMFPMAMIPLGYLVYWLLSGWLWPGEDERNYKKRCTFLILTAFVLYSSGYSIYTQGMFFFIRIWQGKAVLAGILLPLVLYWSLRMQRDGLTKMDWAVMASVMCASCLVSSMGIMLGAILSGTVALAGFVLRPRPRRLAALACCCLPNLALAFVYVLIR